MILSAAIVDKDGVIYVARQYCEMTKAKVEALYIAFSRLITKGKQHTIIDTDEVRYIYRSINDFYCVLVTDKHSNILEDIKTLSLFTSATVQYIGKSITEEAITDVRFDLLFMFDEIVNMGVRQIDNIPQLVTVMDMISEEEKAAQEALSKKEREAKAKAAEKSKELDQQRRNEMLRQIERQSMGAGRGAFGGAGSSAISSSSIITDPVVETIETKPAKPAKVVSRRGRALKLGQKS